jgi:hypothetical protein
MLQPSRVIIRQQCVKVWWWTSEMSTSMTDPFSTIICYNDITVLQIPNTSLDQGTPTVFFVSFFFLCSVNIINCTLLHLKMLS